MVKTEVEVFLRRVRPGARCVVLEISTSHCASQSFTIKSQSSRWLCSHCTVRSSSHDLSAHPVRVLPGFAPHSCQIKDSFQSSEAGLFTRNNANKTEVCANLFAETSKTKTRPRIRTSGQDGQCDLSILQRESEISWLLLPFLSSSLTSSIVLPRHFQRLCSSLRTDTVRKKAMMVGNRFSALLQESELTKNLDTSEIHPTVQWK